MALSFTSSGPPFPTRSEPFKKLMAVRLSCFLNPGGDVCSFFPFENTSSTDTHTQDAIVRLVLFFFARRKEPQRKVGTCLTWEAERRGYDGVNLPRAASYRLRTNVPACDPYFRINEVCLRWRKQQGATKDKDNRATTILTRKEKKKKEKKKRCGRRRLSRDKIKGTLSCKCHLCHFIHANCRAATPFPHTKNGCRQRKVQSPLCRRRDAKDKRKIQNTIRSLCRRSNAAASEPTICRVFLVANNSTVGETSGLLEGS